MVPPVDVDFPGCCDSYVVERSFSLHVETLVHISMLIYNVSTGTVVVIERKINTAVRKWLKVCQYQQ